MSAKMEDVARKAGVSKSTVSFVMNEKPGVSPETVDAVLQAARDLGYQLPSKRPVRKPQNLQKNLTVVHQIGRDEDESIYGLFAEYLHGIRTYAQQANINITVISGYRKGDMERLEDQILKDEKNPLDGLIHMGTGVHYQSSLIDKAIAMDIPQVVLSRNWPELKVSTVSQDHARQSQIALEYLVQQGHQKIAFIANQTDTEFEWFDIRLACYQTLMKKINPENPEGWVILGENGVDSAAELIRKYPEVTAVFAIHDGRAIEVIKGLIKAGLNVPNDISVIGVDGSEDPPAGYPELTTVAVPHFEIGFMAADLLVKQIENHHLEHAKLTVRSNLIVRESTQNIVQISKKGKRRSN